MLELFWLEEDRLDAADANGDTPLHLAAARGMTAAVETMCTVRYRYEHSVLMNSRLLNYVYVCIVKSTYPTHLSDWFLLLL